MEELLQALKGARLLGRLVERGKLIVHWLLPNGRVLEVVTRLEK